MRGHNICFHGEIRKKYLQIIPVIPPYQELFNYSQSRCCPKVRFSQFWFEINYLFFLTMFATWKAIMVSDEAIDCLI